MVGSSGVELSSRFNFQNNMLCVAFIDDEGKSYERNSNPISNQVDSIPALRQLVEASRQCYLC